MNNLTRYFDPHQWGSIYESPSNQNFIFRRATELVEEACLKYMMKGSLLLDVGCGTGHLSVNLSSKGFSVIGVDHDPKMIIYAEKRFSTYLTNSSKRIKLRFLNAKAESLPFEKNSFDGIIAVSFMGCISSPEVVFKEFNRVLHKGGVAIITFTNLNSLILKTNFYLNLIWKKGQNENKKFRLYSLKGVEEYLQKTGFKILEIRYYNFFLNIGNHIFPSKRLSTYLEHLKENRLIRILGRNFLLVLEKV